MWAIAGKSNNNFALHKGQLDLVEEVPNSQVGEVDFSVGSELRLGQSGRNHTVRSDHQTANQRGRTTHPMIHPMEDLLDDACFVCVESDSTV